MQSARSAQHSPAVDILFLGETVTLRLVLASVAILGGIALVILERRKVNGIR